MQMEFKIRRILPVLTGLLFLWIIFLFSKFKLEAKENTNRDYIPANSSWVIRLDGKAFIESAVYDVVYKSGDEEIFRQLQALSKRSASRTEIRDAGIDFFSDVIIFSQPFKNTTLTGILLNLADASRFEKTMPGIALENQAFASKGQTGIILLDPSKSLGKQDLKAHAISLLNRKSKAGSQKSVESQKGDFLSAEWKSVGGNGSLQCKLEPSGLEFSGQFEIPVNQHRFTHTLQPEGFHLSTPVFGQFIQDSLRNLLASQGFIFPDIARISANYRGTNLENGIVPMADLLIEFESEPDLRQLFENEKSWNQLGFSVQASAPGELKLAYYNTTYTLKVAGPKTIFIGQNPSNLLKAKNEHLLLLKGDLSLLTRVEGGGLIGWGINFYPPYKACKELFASINTADAKVVSRNGKYVLTGKITFKEGKYPVSETLRCVLEIIDGL